MWLWRTLHPLNNKQQRGKGQREDEQFGRQKFDTETLWHKLLKNSEVDREEKRSLNDLWAEGRVLMYLCNLFITVCSASSTKDMDTGCIKCSLGEEWIWLFELSQRLLMSLLPFLCSSVSCGLSAGSDAAWSHVQLFHLCKGKLS